MKAKNARILVFTVSAWNNSVGADTWASLLSEYPPENIANICIRDEQPESDACSRYFALSENKIIKSILRRNVQTGREVFKGGKNVNSLDLEQHNRRYRRMQSKRRYSMLMLREAVWLLGKWRTDALDAFLDDFRPDIILHSMEGYIHLNRIVEYAVKRTKAKAVGYIWDDNFTYKQSNRLGYKLYRFFQRRSLKKLASVTDGYFAITEEAKQEADEFFGIDAKVLTKPISDTVHKDYRYSAKPIKMLYTGKLIYGRDDSFVTLVQTIARLGLGSKDILVEAYTQNELSDEVKAKLNFDFCRVYPAIPQSEVFEKQSCADILVFLEATEGEFARVPRLSFSTKITDYFSAGRCILALGEPSTAPMRYFIRNNCALTASNADELARILALIVDSPEIISDYADRSADIGVQNHNKTHILDVFDSVLDSVLTQE